MEGCCEHGNEHVESILAEIFNKLSYYQIVKKNSVSLSC